MSYPASDNSNFGPSFGSSYEPSFGSSYQQPPPPPRRRGLKRTIFGILGIIVNGIGLVVMPILATIIAAVVTGMGSTELTPLDPTGDTIQAEGMKTYSIAVPQADLETAECEITGSDVSVTAGNPDLNSGEVDGVPYYDLYDFNVGSNQEVSVTCTGTESVALWEMSMTGTLISMGVGFILPILLGIASFILMIWGIIALVRSTGSR